MDFNENKISPSPTQSDKRILNEPTKKLSTLTKVFLFALIGFFVSSCIVLTIVLVIYGAFPCSVANCDPNATCINRPFYADCTCNYGYAGNGIECDECGNFQQKWSNAIPFGSSAEPHSWPATVDIIFNYRTEYEVNSEKYLLMGLGNCGGTLINRKTILTTASCIKKSFNTFLKNKTISVPVKLNEYHETFESMYSIYVAVVLQISFTVTNIAPARYIKAEKIIKHELYDPDTDDNDIAIIKLQNRLELDDKVKLSCLPSTQEDTSNYPTKNQYAWGAGWGSSGWGGNGGHNRPNNQPKDLKYYRLEIFNNSMCHGITKVQIDKLNNDVFCAGESADLILGSKTGYCHGDYGSSLYVRQNVSGVEKFVTAGLLSYNEGCNVLYAPGIYTNVVKYLEWIRVNSKY